MLSLCLHFTKLAGPFKIEAYYQESLTSLVITSMGSLERVTVFVDELYQLEELAQALSRVLDCEITCYLDGKKSTQAKFTAVSENEPKLAVVEGDDDVPF